MQSALPDSKCEQPGVPDSLSYGSQGWPLLCHVTITDDEQGARGESGGVCARVGDSTV